MHQSIAKQDFIYALAQKRVKRLLSDIAVHSTTSSELSDTLIHDLRVCAKRLRALLQLYRPCCDKQAIKRVDQDIKAIANVFAGQRDGLVQYQLLSSAIAAISPQHRHDFSPLLAYFLRVITQEKTQSSTRVVERAFKHALNHWQKHLTLKKRNSVNKGLRYTHEQCYKFARRAIATGQDACYHTTRKWLKYYLYQLKLLNPKKLNPDLATATQQLEMMGELLGELHDACVLEETLKQLMRADEKPAELADTDTIELEATINAVLQWLAASKLQHKQQFWSAFNQFFLAPLSPHGHV